MGCESVPLLVDQNCIPYPGMYITLQVLLFAQQKMEAGKYGLHCTGCTANASLPMPFLPFHPPSRSEPIRAI